MTPDARSPGDTPFDWHVCIQQARDGSRAARGRLLEACRHFLLHIANQELDADLRAKASPSDLVQETCLEAHRDFKQFRGGSEEELLAWLRKVLLNNLGHLRQRFTADKRHVGREQSVNGDGSGNDLLDRVAADAPTPSSQVRKEEEEDILERAVERLPEDYRLVIVLRHREYLPFAEIASRMNRKVDAVEKLWSRAVELLKKQIGTARE